MCAPRLPPPNCVWVLSKDTCKSRLVDFATITQYFLSNFPRNQKRGLLRRSNLLCQPSMEQHFIDWTAEMTTTPPPPPTSPPQKKTAATKMNKQGNKEQGNGSIAQL